MSRNQTKGMTRVPDTLDLAEHGALAINGILGTTDPDRKYSNYFLTFFDVHPAYMIHWSKVRGGVAAATADVGQRQANGP